MARVRASRMGPERAHVFRSHPAFGAHRLKLVSGKDAAGEVTPRRAGKTGRRRPPIAALWALEAAARLRSYSRAGDELALTHSAVSQQIRKLEADLGTRLFVREGGAMIPTPPAQQLAAEVVRAMAIIQDALAPFDDDPASQPLVLSVEGMLARRWLPRRLPRLLNCLNLEIRVDNDYANFARDGVDVGIRFGAGEWPGVEARLFMPVALTPMCSPEFAKRHDLRTAEDLARAPLLHRTGRPWSLWFEPHGVAAPDHGLVFDDTLMQLEAALEGLGAILFSTVMVESELEAGRLIRPFAASVPSPLNFYLVWPPDSRRRARIDALHDCLAAEAGAP